MCSSNDESRDCFESHLLDRYPADAEALRLEFVRVVVEVKI